MAEAKSLNDKQQHKIVHNEITNSPIKKVVLVDKTNEYYIALHGQNAQKYVSFRELDQLNYFLNVIKAKAGNKKIISDNIEEAIQNFRPEDRIKNKVSLLYTKMADVLEQKLTQAQQENKKLLILIGDRHDNWDSGFLQLIALDICKKNNIKHFLAEAPKNFMQKPLSYGTEFWQHYMMNLNAPIIFRAALKNNMLLHACDPLSRDWADNKVTFRERGQAINKTISTLNEDAICVTGSAHIADMMSDVLLQSQYLTVTFQTQMIINNSESDIFLRSELDTQQKEVIASIKDAPQNTDIEYLIEKKKSIDNELIKLNLSNSYSIAHKKDDAISSNEEIIILPIKEEYKFEPGKSTSFIPSDIDAINIAIDTISKHNPNSKTLNALQHTKLSIEKIRNILFKCPSYTAKFYYYAQILLDPNYKLPTNFEKLGTGILPQDVGYFKQFSSTLESYHQEENWNDFDDLLKEVFNNTFYPKE